MNLMDIPSSPMEQRALAERGLSPAGIQPRGSAGSENSAEALNKLDLLQDPGAAMGTVNINSRPWAHVFIDGRMVGTTPVRSLQVSVGQHSVLLVNKGFGMSKTIDLSVTADEPVTRVVSLDE